MVSYLKMNKDNFKKLYLERLSVFGDWETDIIDKGTRLTEQG